MNTAGVALILSGVAFALLGLLFLVLAFLEGHVHRQARWGGATLVCLILAAGFLVLSYVVAPPGTL